MSRAPALLFILAALAACTQAPSLDGTVPADLENAPYPSLIPLDRLEAPASAPEVEAARIGGDLSARVAALKAKAARMQGPVVSEDTRARMDAGVPEIAAQIGEDAQN